MPVPLSPLCRASLLSLLTLLLCLHGGGVEAGKATRPGIDHEREYRACRSLVYRDAWAALEAADSWAAVGGGPAALHCAALAHLELDQPDQAALRLERLAANSGRMPPAEAWSQAANAWILARRPAEALAAIGRALALAPQEADLHVDRGRILADLGRMPEARDALARAVELQPDRAETHAFLAAALRRLRQPEEALTAATTALALEPDNPIALLERGLSRLALADRPGARDDFVEILRRHDGTPAAEIARRRLEALALETR